MKLGSFLPFACALFTLLMLSGCASTAKSNHKYFMKTKSEASVFVDSQPPAVRKIAIMPFSASTELIGSSISEILITELLKSGFYTLVERSQMSKFLSETELSASGMTASRAVEVGHLVGADGVILGTVDQYENQAYRGKIYPIVGITLRLIDCETGKIGWSVDMARKSKDKKDVLSSYSRAIIHEMISGLYHELDRLRIPADPKDVSAVSDELCEVKILWDGKADKKACFLIERSTAPEGEYVCVGETGVSKGVFTDEDLDYGTKYYYRVVARYKNRVKSKAVGPVEVTTYPRLGMVNEFTAEGGLVRSVPLTWAAPGNALHLKGYEIHRSDDGAPFRKIKFVKGKQSTSYMDGGEEPGRLKDNLRYTYKIYGVDVNRGLSGVAAKTDALTRSAPPAVKGLIAVSDNPREIPLTWEKSEDEKTEGYYIERLNQRGDWSQIAKVNSVDTTDFLDKGNERKAGNLGKLLDNHKYSYRIAVYNIAGVMSEWSKPALAITKKPPAMPSSPICTTDLEGRIELSWTPNAENDINHYVVEVCKGGAKKYNECGTVKESSFVHAVNEDGLKCSYRIIAVDDDRLCSGCSVEADGATKDAEPVIQ